MIALVTIRMVPGQRITRGMPNVFDYVLISCQGRVFVAFVEDNATKSSIRYFENHVSYLVQKPKEVDPIKLIFQSSSPNQFVPDTVSTLSVRPYLFVIYNCLLTFSKNSFLSLAPFTNATPAFSTL